MAAFFLHHFQKLIIFTASVMLFASGSLYAETQLPVESPLAMVNGVVLSNGELQSEMRLIEAELDYRNRPITSSQLQRLMPQTTDLLIDRELLYQQARKRNLIVRRRWIARATEDLKTRLGSTTALDRYLKSAQISKEDFNRRLEKGLVIRRLLHREVLRDIKISENEMQIFYQKHPEFFMAPPQVRARHIMISLPADASEDQRNAALAQLQDIRNRIEQGGNFSVMALEYSDCPSKYRGGDLGFFSHNEVLPSIAEVAFSLKSGQLSDIITSRHGLHIVQTLAHKPSSQMAYRNTRDKIERTLRRNK